MTSRKYLLAFILGLLLLSAPGHTPLAAELTRSTATEITGKDVKLGVTFHARRDESHESAGDWKPGDDVYLVDIDFARVKRLSARINYTRLC